VLDGFPRTVVQATALDGLVGTRGQLVVLDIVVPEEVLVQRLETRRICSRCGANASEDAQEACTRCGGSLVIRTDDGAGIVRERLKVYQRQTKPLVDYYAARQTFRSIDGNQAADAVTMAIETAILEAVAGGGARS
jgi:adenylate kinase